MLALATVRRGEVLGPIIRRHMLRVFAFSITFNSVYIAGRKDQFKRREQWNLTYKPSSGIRDTDDSSERVHGVESMDVIM